MAGPPPEGTPPDASVAQRASDADRERTADRLRRAAGDGRITVDELDDRLQRAYAARTRAELEPLVADVLDREDVERPRAGGVTVRRGEGGSRWILSIMGGADRSGRWRLARQCTVLNVMGGADLDLNEVELADDVVELQVFSLMGGSDIYVPDGLNVEVSEFAFMGGNGIDIGAPDPAPGGPTVRLRVISIMGGTDVRRGRKRSWRDRHTRQTRHLDRPHR